MGKTFTRRPHYAVSERWVTQTEQEFYEAEEAVDEFDDRRRGKKKSRRGPREFTPDSRRWS